MHTGIQYRLNCSLRKYCKHPVSNVKHIKCLQFFKRTFARIPAAHSAAFQSISPTGAVPGSTKGRFLTTGCRCKQIFQGPSSLGLCNPTQSIVSSLIEFNYFDKRTLNTTIFKRFQKKTSFTSSVRSIQSEMAVHSAADWAASVQ